ncbi:hypothetical protein M422DRAFT_271133 [Sphaerobolus stellatus SS14]|uniref:Uncharacterized protein n=1 Tax=Sphaerobolus stellatus (strain SS14) TaxID=990650 RepID=A0A0C9UQP5_SPHS4|nr:hypothetical protein M422DRAFT_271133 [Sphaerobolus stellatus SS14]
MSIDIPMVNALDRMFEMEMVYFDKDYIVSRPDSGLNSPNIDWEEMDEMDSQDHGVAPSLPQLQKEYCSRDAAPIFLQIPYFSDAYKPWDTKEATKPCMVYGYHEPPMPYKEFLQPWYLSLELFTVKPMTLPGVPGWEHPWWNPHYAVMSQVNK